MFKKGFAGVIKGLGWPEKFFGLLVMLALFGPLLVGKTSLIAYEPNELATGVYYKSPLTKEGDQAIHWLGTDGLGRDVASRLIYGTRTAMMIGAGVVLISLVLSVILALIAGYVGNDRISFNLLQVLLLFCLLPIVGFYFSQPIALIYKLLFILVLILVVYWSQYVPLSSFHLPVDTLIIKMIEIFKTIPALFIILSFFAVNSDPGILNVILILGLMSWPNKTRLLRAEILRAKSQNYIKNAQITGLGHWRIITSHLLPNVINPLLVACCFTFSSAVLLESTLSFLNVGLPHDIPTWGSMLRDAKEYIPAWWLAVFPGSLLFLIILTLNAIVERHSLNK